MRFVRFVLLILSMLLSAGFVFGQTTSTGSGQPYPNKPIRIVTTEAGGVGDIAARLIAQGLTNSLGQQVIVDNRPSGLIPGQIVSLAPSDGYTLLLSGAIFWIAPLIQKAPYDPVKDFSPITLATKSPNILVVHPSLPATSVKELIALAKASPGKLNYGSAGTGSPVHLAAELFKSMTGVDIVNITYKGGGPALTALAGNEVQLIFATAGSAMPFVKSGRLKALAVTSAQPSVLFPGLPTVAATVPGYDVGNMNAIFVPAKTSKALVDRLNAEIVRVLNSQDLKGKLLNVGLEAGGGSPDEFAAAMKADMAAMGKVIKDLGIRAD